MEQWIEEFLFRGRPPGSTEPPAYHVVIGQQVSDPFEPDKKTRRLLGPMTPEQAEAMGFPASALVAGINDAAVAEVAKAHDAVIAAIGDATAERQARIAAEDQVAALRAEIAALQAAANVTASTEAALRAELAAMRAVANVTASPETVA